MRLGSFGQYDRDGNLRGVEAWFLYAAFATPVHGRALVKVGISQVPMKRIYSVHTGSPYPIEVALWAQVGRKSHAMSIEKTVRERLLEFRARGEWFDFDTTSAEHKDRFHAVCRLAYMRATGRKLEWRKSTMRDIVDFNFAEKALDTVRRKA